MRPAVLSWLESEWPGIAGLLGLGGGPLEGFCSLAEVADRLVEIAGLIRFDKTVESEREVVYPCGHQRCLGAICLQGRAAEACQHRVQLTDELLQLSGVGFGRIEAAGELLGEKLGAPRLAVELTVSMVLLPSGGLGACLGWAAAA